MRKSIFDLELRVDINYEFKRLKEVLFLKNGIAYEGHYYSLYDFLNEEVFPIWKHRGMFVDFDDFCERLDIGIEDETINEEEFLYLLELLVNLWMVGLEKINSNEIEYCSSKVIGYLKGNLPLLIEKMNYQIIRAKDIFRIIKRDADVDSILDLLPNNCAELLLDYNDIRNNTLAMKKTILKKLDLFIEENKRKYQSYDTDTYNSIQIIVNKMGINHPIKEEPYTSLDDNGLIEWYDKCFKLMIHLIRKENIININNERKSLIER